MFLLRASGRFISKITTYKSTKRFGGNSKLIFVAKFKEKYIYVSKLCESDIIKNLIYKK